MGVAKGLAYPLHNCCPQIIHRDIKSSNILLDGNFDARVSDFGLAKLLADEESHITTFVAGTFVYLAPEYMQSGRATGKTDVYSFGVLVLEIVSGKWPTDASFIEKGFNIVGWYSLIGSTRSKKEVVGRLVTVNPCEGEHFYERLLLNNIKAPPSIQFLRTVNGHEYYTFREAALQLGLLESDSYIYECLEEACLHQMAYSLRRLFGTLLVFCNPTDPVRLWTTFAPHLSHDLVSSRNSLMLSHSVGPFASSSNFELENVISKS